MFLTLVLKAPESHRAFSSAFSSTLSPGQTSQILMYYLIMLYKLECLEKENKTTLYTFKTQNHNYQYIQTIKKEAVKQITTDHVEIFRDH